MSQKSSTFALVIELERHIEILLLSNDCVIVPDLGGFMTHHIEARYDEESGTFLPPQRTLGFNPLLKLNDSLLAHSYIEAYEISYPEAIRRIETEVAELKQNLANDGYYELNDIGRLTVNDEGKLEFSPCEAGILTPELYGLSSFEMLPLDTVSQTKVKPAETIMVAAVTADDDTVADTEEVQDTEDGSERAITIKLSWVRNTVAVAAALLAFLFITPSVSNHEEMGINISQMGLPIMQRDTNVRDVKKLDKQVVKEVLQKQNSPQETEESEAVEQAKPQKTEQQQLQTSYCIVLASQVSERNATEFVVKLQKMGIEDARIYVHSHIRRVVCGSYQTEAEAYRHLQSVHQCDGLEEAWVYKIKE